MSGQPNRPAGELGGQHSQLSMGSQSYFEQRPASSLSSARAFTQHNASSSAQYMSQPQQHPHFPQAAPVPANGPNFGQSQPSVLAPPSGTPQGPHHWSHTQSPSYAAQYSPSAASYQQREYMPREGTVLQHPRQVQSRPMESYQYANHVPSHQTPESSRQMSRTQSPMSSALRGDSGAPVRAFNLLAGLETPTYSDPARRLSDTYNEEFPQMASLQTSPSPISFTMAARPQQRTMPDYPNSLANVWPQQALPSPDRRGATHTVAPYPPTQASAVPSASQYHSLAADSWQGQYDHGAPNYSHVQSQPDHQRQSLKPSATYTSSTGGYARPNMISAETFSSSYADSLHTGLSTADVQQNMHTPMQSSSSNSLDAAWTTSRKKSDPIPSASFYARRVPQGQASASKSSVMPPSQSNMDQSALIAPKTGWSATAASSSPSSAQPMRNRLESHPSSLGGSSSHQHLAGVSPVKVEQPTAYSTWPRTPPQSSRSIAALQESPDPLSFFSPSAPPLTWQAIQQPDHRPPPPSFSPVQISHRTKLEHPSMPPSTNKAETLKRKDEPIGKIVLKKRKKAVKAASDQLQIADSVSDNPPLYNANIAAVTDQQPYAAPNQDHPHSEVGNEYVQAIPEHDFTQDHDDDFGSQKVKQKKQKKKTKKEKSSAFDLITGFVEDSDSGMDAEGSDWDEIDMIETWNTSMTKSSNAISPSLNKISTGPVKSSIRKVPLAKLQGFIEDLFEADDALPDKDCLQDMRAGQSLSHDADQFFEVVEEPSLSGQGRQIVLLRAAALQKLLKLVVKCSLPLSEVSGLKAPASAQVGLSTIPAADLTRLLAVVERTAKITENIDPFSSHTVRQAVPEPVTPSKKRKESQNGQPSRSPSKSPASEEEADEDVFTGENKDVDHPITSGQSPLVERQSTESYETLDKVNSTLVIVDRSILAIECCLSILSGDVLPKQVMSEDLVRTCFDCVKTCLDRVILPFIEACSGAAAIASHPALVQLIDVLAPQKARKKKVAQPADDSTQNIGIICRNTLSDLFHHLCSALFFIQRMVRMASVTLSDSIIISAVYLALGPFFVMEPEPGSVNATSENAKVAARGRLALLSLGGANAMKTLRLPSLHLLRNIFAKAPDQRQWMIEEILTSLTKLTDMKKHRRQYSLRNGKAIHSINALLLQLIQGASHGVGTYVRVAVDRFNRNSERRDDELSLELGYTNDLVLDAFNAGEPGLDAKEVELAIWRRGLEGANQSARSIATYLMQKVGQNKVAKSSMEMSHTFIIENSIQDLLSALFLPEWPAAALMLSAFCRTFGAFLEDPKSHPDAKGVALEQLGLIATRLRQSQITLSALSADSVSGANEPTPGVQPLSTTWDHLSMLRALRDHDQRAIGDLVTTCTLAARFLTRSASEDQSTEGAFEFMIVQAQGELALAHAKTRDAIEDCRSNTDSSEEQLKPLLVFREQVEIAVAALSNINMHEGDLAWAQDESDEKALAQAMLLCEKLTTPCSSMVTYESLRDLLIEGLNSQLIANRSKALRGIDKIAQVDPDVLDQESIRAAIEVRLRDSSNAVRDSAVGLFGNFVLRKPEHLPAYYPQLAARIHDTGLSVRKRMVRLLKSIHESTGDWSIRVDSCVRIVRCINDEDSVVQDLAVLTIGEMWLDLEVGDLRRPRRPRSPAAQTTSVDTNGEGPNGTVKHDVADSADEKMSDTIDVIMAVAETLKERPSPFEELFRRIFKDRSEAEAADLHSKVQRLGDSMINGLVESNEVSSVDTVKRIRIVQLLVSTNPAILTISKAKMLLPYLKAAQTSEEIQIMDLLLRIFRSCLPHMPKTALAFAEALERSLRPLVNRPPPKAGLHLLQELIACYCAVITVHTHNFRLLVQTLRACFVRVRSMREMALKGQRVEDVKAWSTLMSLTASLCEHADFDHIRDKYPDTKAEIDALCPRPLVDVISEALLDIHQHSSETVRSIALQNLGFIFRAYPTTMTRPAMTNMMDSIFAKGSSQDRATLLKIVLDFLSADSVRRNPDQTIINVGGARRKPERNVGSVDMTVLVGNTESFADTGVGAAMMQRYSEDVLKASLEVSNPSLQRTAVEILRYTVLNGLSHPIQCVPYLVSLETLEDRKIRSRALDLHSHLASKHASLVQARFLDSARSAFKFQLTHSSPELLRGFRVDTTPTAMLDAWYSLLKDRRATRLDFLRQIVKATDVNTAVSDCSVQETVFARFIADNLATLDYKTTEEVLTVIGELRSILAVSGMQVLYMIQSHISPEPILEPGQMAANDGARTPPHVGSSTVGNLISPMGVARNPWTTGEWQAQASPASNSIESRPISIGANDEAIPHEVESNSEKSIVNAIAVARMSVIAGTALLLRNHLKNLYSLSEARCAKFNPSKKQSAGADRPATMRGLSDPMQVTLDFGVMPFALNPITSDTDAQIQMTTYAAMVESEGTMIEPEDADMMDDIF